MFDAILQYLRSWFPTDDYHTPILLSRKRRGSENFPIVRSPKQRKVLSSMSNVIDDDGVVPPLKSRVQRQAIADTSILIDDDVGGASSPPNRVPGRKSLENRYSPNGNDDLSYIKAIRSTTEKRKDSRRSGYEYITRFSTNREPRKSPALLNGSKHKPGPRSLNNTLISPTLDYSVRLEDKKRYQMLLDNVARTSFNSSLNSTSSFGTPFGSLNRSARLVDLAQQSKLTPTEYVDLTTGNRTMSTKDLVIKILDDFDNEAAVINDSDSDVEILPTPPSPKPDIKVEPVNTLKTVIDTSKATHQKWLDDVTKKHELYLEEKSKEIEVYKENSSSLNKINHDLLIKSLSKRVHDSLAIKDTILPIVEDEEEFALPDLTDEQLRAVKNAFSGDPNEVLTKKFNLNLSRRDIKTLAGLNWLNDNVINFYMNLIIERGKDSKWPRAYAMNTFFYQKLTSSGPESLKRWTRRVDIFAHDFICVPIHLGMHWCMAIINLNERSIKYYDSMGQSNNQCLKALRGYLEFEHQDKKNQPYSTEDFVLENVQDIPQQMNGSDCGMFSCTFAEFATRNAKFSFQQEDMPYLRKKMVVEILTGELLIK